MRNFYFLHTATARSWLTDDPHHWLIDHRDDDLLTPARERLSLSADDPERCLRVAARRCGLALIHITTDSQIVVQHWSDPMPDLRAWAKAFGLDRSGTGVVFESLKTGKVVVDRDAEDLLVFGERVGSGFPWEEYAARYARRHDREVEDHDTAPASVTNFSWEGSPAGWLTWWMLKAIWNAEQLTCPNCDQPLVLVAAEWRTGMLSFRSARIVRHCFRCRRRSAVAEERPLAWLAKVLPPALRPTHVRLWSTISINWSVLSLNRGEPVQLGVGEG